MKKKTSNIQGRAKGKLQESIMKLDDNNERNKLLKNDDDLDAI